jgi:hypothetical protein
LNRRPTPYQGARPTELRPEPLRSPIPNSFWEARPGDCTRGWRTCRAPNASRICANGDAHFRTSLRGRTASSTPPEQLSDRSSRRRASSPAREPWLRETGAQGPAGPRSMYQYCRCRPPGSLRPSKYGDRQADKDRRDRRGHDPPTRHQKDPAYANSNQHEHKCVKPSSSLG